MKRKIYLNMIVFASGAAVLACAAFVFVMYAFSKNAFDEVIRLLPAAGLCVAVILIAGCFVALYLTNKIVKPFTDIDWDRTDEMYDELSPFIRRINRQREQIDRQADVYENRTETFDLITENMNEGMILIDWSSVIISANRSAISFFGTDSGCIGKSMVEVTRNIDILDRVKAVLDGDGGDLILDIGNKSYDIFFSPVSGGGALILLLDITDRFKAERLRREFTANVSHELKTPLTTILGYAEMISGGMVKTSDIGSFVGKIKTEATRLIGMTEDIIKLSQLDESGSDRQFESFDLISVAREAAESLRASAEERRVTVMVPENKVIIWGNRQLIYDLLLNLIDNAIKYNKPGGKVTVEATGTEIVVTDTGIGIPVEHHERIFERFYRVDKSRSKKTGGTGLGLSIVKHIAQYHNGTVELDSEENVGTKVIIRL